MNDPIDIFLVAVAILWSACCYALGQVHGVAQAIRAVARKNRDAIAAVEDQQLKDHLQRRKDYE